MAVILGTPFSDLLFGTDVNDVIRAFEGDDLGFGLAGDDEMQGNPGDDTLLGNLGNDTLYGGFSDDLLYGGKDTDVLFGDRGDDTLIGNLNADFLQGGEGFDLFVIGPSTGGSSIQESDIISDFVIGEDLIGLIDGLNFRDLNIQSTTVDNIDSTIIEDNATGEILAVLQGINRADIGPGNFTTFIPTFNPNLPTVSVVATDGTATEGPFGTDDGVFTFTRTNTTGNLTVNYVVSGTALNGTDYLNIPNAVTIPEGQSSVTVTISAFADGVIESTESVIIDISPSAAYNVGAPNNAQVSIIDDGIAGGGGGGVGPIGSGGGGGGGGSTGATTGDDLLVGTTSADTINSLAGNDTLLGLDGNDTLTGGPGNDILTGGLGNDTFVYNSFTEGIDIISDFVAETIRVSASGFNAAGSAVGLVAGVLPAAQFESGPGLNAAVNPTTRFIYNTTTGELRFDADGNTVTIAPTLIATLTGAPALTEANITVF
jgi:Ca2+-binding RTX toxin-like protein